MRQGGPFVVVAALDLDVDLFQAGFEGLIPLDVLAYKAPRGVERVSVHGTGGFHARGIVEDPKNDLRSSLLGAVAEDARDYGGPKFAE